MKMEINLNKLIGISVKTNAAKPRYVVAKMVIKPS